MGVKSMGKSQTAMKRIQVTGQLLEQITRNIVNGFDPEKVILFGSHAWGAPEPDSDVDLLVVLKSELRAAQRSAQISMACRPKHLAMDIVARTPEEVDHRLEINDPFMKRILTQGKVLYER